MSALALLRHWPFAIGSWRMRAFDLLPLRLAVLLANAFAVQALGFAISPTLGGIGFYIGVALIAVASWSIGTLVKRPFLIVAASACCLFGAAYWLVDWQFLRFFRVDFLHQAEESVSWEAGIYALLFVPIVLLSGMVGAVACWR